MRLTCPNCAAQYEIDASLLPEDGREVQCSACGHIWFQESRTALQRPVASEPVPAAAPATAPQADAPRPDTVPSSQTPDVGPDDQLHDTPLDEIDAAQPSVARQPAPKPVDKNVLGILRDEAAFEAEQRARDANRLESQPELGLLGAAPWPKSADSSASTETIAQDEAGHSKAAFPDIEDISSTLEPIGAARKSASADTFLPATPEAKKRSFLGGLLIPVAIALILVALYIAAAALAEAVPALAPVLYAYVAFVDTAREAVAGLVGR